MTQHRVTIDPSDKAAWHNWMDALRAMVHELRELKDEKVTGILDRFECRECDYGFGLNVDWPDDLRPPQPEHGSPE